MEGLTIEIFDWLEELEEHEAAKFVANCHIENFYIDTLFSMDSDKETYLHEVTVFVPLKTYKALEQYSEIVKKIEQAISEAGDSNGIHIRATNWKAYLPSTIRDKNHELGEKISEILSQDYVRKQIKLMTQSIKQNSHLAIGTAKELIETCCKHILKEEGIQYERDWDIQKLVKETNKVIELVPFEVDNKEVVKISTAKILSGFSNIVHGITELRNSYGSGHGHEPNFKMIDEVYIKLAVSAAGELAIFYLSLQNAKNKSSS